jgi:hypothetical protein
MLISQKICGSTQIDQLEKIHLNCNDLFLKKGTDQRTSHHASLYQEFDKGLSSGIVKAYRSLALEWIFQLREQKNLDQWAIQRYPTLRIHKPRNLSVYEFHRDSTYNHPLGEINHFLSITKSVGSACLHVEETLGWGDYKSLDLDSGQSAILNTSIFEHGDFINEENYTRVSIDFRAFPLRVLEKNIGKASISKGRLFSVSDYFVKDTELFVED